MTTFPERLGFDVTSIDEHHRTTTATLTVQGDMLNANDTVHGGVLATLVDATMAEAVRSLVDDEHSAVTVSMTVAYLDAAYEGDELLAEAQVRKAGKTLALLEADISRVADDAAIVHAVATFRITSKG